MRLWALRRRSLVFYKINFSETFYKYLQENIYDGILFSEV